MGLHPAARQQQDHHPWSRRHLADHVLALNDLLRVRRGVVQRELQLHALHRGCGLLSHRDPGADLGLGNILRKICQVRRLM